MQRPSSRARGRESAGPAGHPRSSTAIGTFAIELPPGVLLSSLAMRPHLRSQTPAALAALFPDLELDRAWRAASWRGWWARTATTSTACAGCRARAGARRSLARGRARRACRSCDRRRSAVDPFVKYLFRADDGQRVRGRAHPARAAALERVRLVAGGLRAGLRVLRDGPARLHAQPRAVGDGRAGAHRPPRVAGAAGHRRRLPGPGRALPELRQRDPGGGGPARPLRRRASAATASRSRPWACCP